MRLLFSHFLFFTLLLLRNNYKVLKRQKQIIQQVKIVSHRSDLIPLLIYIV